MAGMKTKIMNLVASWAPEISNPGAQAYI